MITKGGKYVNGRLNTSALNLSWLINFVNVF